MTCTQADLSGSLTKNGYKSRMRHRENGGKQILTCRLLMAAEYLAEAMTAGIVRMAKIGKSDAGYDRAR